VASTADPVRIRYRRPPGREDIFLQQLVHRQDDCIVTYLEHTSLKKPALVDDAPILENGSPAIWFTFPDRWHDIGRFHLADGTYTGLYANILTPVLFNDAISWETVDLFLDVWCPAHGSPRLLDEDEFEDAVNRGWIDEMTARQAREEADRLLDAARTGAWPPAVVDAWTLDRIRSYGTL
jgi:predicted RNA-binding protein associated with RNAse of E/G family